MSKCHNIDYRLTGNEDVVTLAAATCRICYIWWTLPDGRYSGLLIVDDAQSMVASPTLKYMRIPSSPEWSRISPLLAQVLRWMVAESRDIETWSA